MNDACPPEPFVWTDEGVMKPLRPRRADAFYAVGERYILAPVALRSDATHKHEFAWLREAWMSLPDHLAERFPTSEHLRKWALIRAGYSDSHTITCFSKAEALRVAAFIRPIDEFAVVVTHEATVTRYTAKSQSRRAMGAKDFQDSKTKIMEIVARMLDVEPAALPEHEAA
jgi:hypothetical protein